MRARRSGEPRRMSGLVGRRAGAVLGRHQRAVAQPLRSADRAQRGMADAVVDRLLRIAPRRRLRRRASRRNLARRSRRQARAQGRGRSVRPCAPSVQRRQGRSPGPPLGREHEREARREHGQALSPRSGFQAYRDDSRHHDLQRPCVQPDARTLYHADTPTRTITAWDFDAATGGVANRRIFAQFVGETERPDGGAIDREGCYWSAFYGGGKVVRLSPRGERLAEFAVPAMCPTMCAFGGPDLKTLYVSSARQRREPDELARLPHSGGIFAMRVTVPGLPEPKFAG